MKSLPALLAASVAFAFLPCLGNGFTNWDDDKLILGDPVIRNFSWDLASGRLDQAEGPLTLLSLAIDHAIGGLDPLPYHMTSFILHVLNCLLLYFLLMRMGFSAWTSFIGALLFGLHPLRVEAVAWASARKDVLSAFFYFLGLWCYQGYLTSPSRKRYITVLISFILALASKPVAVSFPFVLLLQDMLAGRKLTKSVWIEKLPFLLLAAVMAALTYMAQNEAIPSAGLFTNLLIGARGFSFYIYKTFWPVGLSSFYPYPEAIEIRDPVFLSSIFVILLSGILVFWLRKRSPYIVFGALYFTITLLPVLKIIPVGNAAAADRYTYIPTLGFCVILCFLIDRLTKMKRPAVVFACLLAVVLGFQTHGRCMVWKDSCTLWSDVISKYPNLATAHYNLGLALRDSGDHEAALSHYHRVLEIDPDFPEAANNIAYILRRERRYLEAEGFCRKALEMDPGLWEARVNLAFILGETGRVEEALVSADRALAMNEESPDAWYIKGYALYHLGREAEAVECLDRAAGLSERFRKAAEEIKSRIQ